MPARRAPSYTAQQPAISTIMQGCISLRFQIRMRQVRSDFKAKSSLMKPILLALILVLLATGCDAFRCSEAEYRPHNPGVCGKLYRLDQARERYRTFVLPAVYVIFGLVFLPVFIKIIWHLIRQFLIFLGRLFSRRD